MQTLISAYERLLAEVATDLHAACGIMEVVSGETSSPKAIATYGEVQAPAHNLTWLVLPVYEEEVLIAVLRLGFPPTVPLPDTEEQRLAQALVELAVLLSRARSQGDSARQASRRILSVTEEELQRVILDIHDGPVQKLFAASSQVTLMQSRLTHVPEPLRTSLETELARIAMLLETSLNEIKTSVGTMRPPEFRRRPLVSVLQGLIMQHEAMTGMRVELTVRNEIPPVSPPVKIAMYRILQEALSNAYRHAGVDQLDVSLACEEGWVTLDIQDSGRGFEPPPLEGPSATEREEHIGLRGMRERAQLVGGYLRLTSYPGQGTHIQVKAPSDV
ncbi:MAG: sensor histidine kinase [Anaerolineae bacterium]